MNLRNKLVQGTIYSQCEKPQFTCEKVNKILDLEFSEKYIKIINFLSQYYACAFGEAVKLFIPFQKAQQNSAHHIETSITLSEDQQKAYTFVLENQTSLLFGDTGSGKTEIYMKLFEKMINDGKSVIFLMPEISLTPQMQHRLKNHFGDLVAIWHSKVTKKRKEAILEGIYSGEIKIIAGARSSLFLPLLDIGLIVVDEEHDDSYKASNRPRYHARDSAIYVGQVLGAKVLLGSATPSLTSYHKFPHFRLKGTFFKGSKEITFVRDGDEIDQSIYDQMHHTMDQAQQAIIFLPTRANFKYLSCISCGKFVECPFCSVSMSIHLEKNAMRCHYCNYLERIPKNCPSCNSDALKSSRIGTAQVVEEFSNHFPTKRFMKFDRDEITTERKLKSVLKSFNDKEIDVLVGTQMLSKGHDYHDIKLVVILGIDTVLAMADFRARERALSLLLQVAGRVGRRESGKVIIQTNNREFFERYLDDYGLFLDEELAYREGLYPPFKKLMTFLISHKSKQKAREILEKLQECLVYTPEVEVVGFGEAPIAKIASKYRFTVLLRSDSPKALLALAAKCKMPNVEIDIDPVSFA